MTKELMVELKKLQTLEEIREVLGYLKRLRDKMNRELTMDFCVGQTVVWDGRQGEKKQGVIRKVNQKTLSIEIPRNGGIPERWKVSSCLVRVVE